MPRNACAPLRPLRIDGKELYDLLASAVQNLAGRIVSLENRDLARKMELNAALRRIDKLEAMVAALQRTDAGATLFPIAQEVKRPATGTPVKIAGAKDALRHRLDEMLEVAV